MSFSRQVEAFFPNLKRKLDLISGLPIIHTQSYECALPENHRFRMKKFSGTFNSLVHDGIINPTRQVIEPPQVSAEIASLAHCPKYVDNFFNGKTSPEEQKRTGFHWTHGLASRVRYETGGTLLGGLVALNRGLACSTGGGTHHAGPDYGSGFCLINDLAVTSLFLTKHLNDIVRKVLIVDLDVHQGDGTALILTDKPNVFTFSMHSEKNFPFRKQKSDLDVPVEDGAGDQEYMKILSDVLPDLLTTFRPDLVLYDAGVDVHEDDELGRLKLTDFGIQKRDTYVIKECQRFGAAVCTVIGGGYHKNIKVLSERHSIVHRVATKLYK